MRNLNVGVKKESFMIDNDPERVIGFYTSDVGILSRIDKVLTNINEYKELCKEINEHDVRQAIITVDELEKKLCEQVDYIFGEGAAKAAFGGVSPVAVCKEDGKLLFEKFFDAVVPVIEEAMKESMAASRKRMAKHTAKYTS